MCLNLFDGPIPGGLQDFIRITTIDVHNNYFTGTLPPWFGTAPRLETLLIRHNYFYGNLDLVFDTLLFNQSIEVIDISNNLFSGSLPRALFKMKRTKSIDASSNCFSGHFPLEICDAESLEVLVLGALSMQQRYSIK